MSVTSARHPWVGEDVAAGVAVLPSDRVNDQVTGGYLHVAAAGIAGGVEDGQAETCHEDS